ncbi:MAG: ABC transporter substrate-binding protein [Taibaiella sp.]|nr:ABC transporter substrate-binding protein [Taibaiella sp.]
MMERQVMIDYPPQRIVSVVPSQTELLYDLGLDEKVVGITKFCVHPNEWFRNKTRVGGTKKLDIQKILALKPDLVLANKEENDKAQIEELERHLPVWVSDIHTVDEAFDMIKGVGAITNTETKAAQLLADITNGFSQLNKTNTPKHVAYFIWRNPWMSIGGDTFISDMLARINWQNVLADKTRYPEIELAVLKGYDPELILLSSEPYPFKEKHIAEINAVLPDAQVILVDGEMFSWYGTRMLKAIEYLKNLAEQY